MVNFYQGISIQKKLLAVTLFCLAILAAGCTDKTGALEDPLPPFSYITPTIQNLQKQSTSISVFTGGILRLSCEWTCPNVVATATAYLGFVRTIANQVTEPVGIIASDVATLTRSLRAAMLFQTATTTISCIASDSTAFYQRFKDPIAIPSRIGTDVTAGLWSAEIPFTHEDIASAPLGVHQMILYMYLNGVKTNTLSFEITFTE